MVRVARAGAPRWHSPDGKRYYTWDSLHGEVEVFSHRGRHLGAIDPLTGELVSGAVRGPYTGDVMVATFIEQCLAGDVDPDDIDDFVDAWHDGAGPGTSLEDFLGMDATEYALWVERLGLLPSILAAHRSGMPLESAIIDSGKLPQAASAISPDDAREILVWLKRTRRI